jgi:hypothetical protein
MVRLSAPKDPHGPSPRRLLTAPVHAWRSVATAVLGWWAAVVARVPRCAERDLLAECVTELPRRYPVVRKHVRRLLENQPQKKRAEAQERYGWFVACYQPPARRALALRRVVDALVHVIETGAPIALAVYLFTLHAPAVAAGIAGAAVLALLLAPYVLPSGHRPAMARATALFGIALIGEVALFAQHTWALLVVGDPQHPVLRYIGVTTLAATAALIAVLLIDALRGHRRSLVGYFLLRSARCEIVAELVSVVVLLSWMPDATPGPDRCKALAVEKLERLRYLFRRRTVLNPSQPVDRNRRVQDRRGRRALAREMDRHRDRVSHGGLTDRKDVAAALRQRAAELLIGEDPHAESTRRRAERRERVLLRVTQAARIAVLPVFAVGTYLVFVKLGLPDGAVLTALAAVAATAVVTSFKQLAAWVRAGADRRFSFARLSKVLRTFGRSSAAGEDKPAEPAPSREPPTSTSSETP